MKLNKRMKNMYDQFDLNKKYDIFTAILLLKKLSVTKFIESVDIAINLNIDPKKSDQNIRGFVILPHGIGKLVRVAVFTQGKNVALAKKAGAELVGSEDLAAIIKSGKLNFDIVIASPDTMHIVSQLGQILGPRGLMPNPKTGTVSVDIFDTVKNIKKGQICYKNDKNGIVHATIGKINFEENHLKENFLFLLNAVKKIKPKHTKGIYVKKITISTTMGIGIIVEDTVENKKLN